MVLATTSHLRRRRIPVEVRRVDRMAGLPQFVGEVEEPARLSVRMMEQEHRRHLITVANIGRPEDFVQPYLFTGSQGKTSGQSAAR
jgi:hypothetical protein